MPQLNASRVIAVLVGSVLLGGVLGWEIGKMINKALEIKKKQDKIAVSWTADSALKHSQDVSPPVPGSSSPPASSGR